MTSARPASNRRLGASLAALLLGLLAVEGAAAGLRLGEEPFADPYVRWSVLLEGLELSVELPPFDPDEPALPGFGDFDVAGLRAADERLRALGPLPVRYVRLPLPATGEVGLDVRELRFADGSIYTIGRLDGRQAGPGRNRSPELPGELAPASPLSLDGVGFDGDQRFAYLRLMPLLRALDGGPDLQLVGASARLHVGRGLAPAEPPGAPGPLEGRAALSRPGEDLAAPPSPEQLRVRVSVDLAGLQVLDRAALEAAAPELLAAAPSRLRLTRDGREVASVLRLDPAGEFAALEFVAGPRLDEAEIGVFQGGDFSDRDVLFVELAPPGASGLRFATRDVAPSGTREPEARVPGLSRLEEDGFFYNTVSRPEFDHWAWGPMLRSDGSLPDTLAIPLDLPGLDPGAPELVAFQVHWHGRGEGDLERPHRTELHLGGALLSRDDWEGFTGHVQSASARALAVAGAGELVLAVPGLPGTGTDGASLDTVVVAYPRRPTASEDLLDTRAAGRVRLRIDGFGSEEIRLFDTSVPDRPVELIGGRVEAASLGHALTVDLETGPLGVSLRFVGPAARQRPQVERSAPEELLSPSSGADWIAILPEALAASALLDDLVGARAAGGFRPRVLRLQDVFDVFAAGRPDPRAITRLAAHARSEWPEPRPQVLLLLGDGSQDFKGIQDPGASVLPALLFSDPAERLVIGHHAGDSRAGAVQGLDFLPELAVGRIPARTAAELDAALAKILAAESRVDAPWRRRVVLAADDARAADGHAALADALAAATPAPFRQRRVGGAEMLRDELPVALAEEGGAAVLLYVGEGAIDRWTPPGSFFRPYLETADAPALQPGGPYPVFIDGGSLLTGAYQHEATVPSLQEVLLLQPGAGSAGGIAPSSVVTPELGHEIVRAAHAALFGLDRVGTLGELAEQVRRRLDAIGGPRTPEAVAGLIVFGDPAMPLGLPLPPRPPYLVARAGLAEILLSWAAPPDAPPGASYRLYRADEAAGPFAVIAEGSGLAQADTDVVPERTYHYRVTLVDAEGIESPASNRARGRLGEDDFEVFGCRPNSGPLDGGQLIVIVGRGFAPGAEGFLDGLACASSTWLSPFELQCETPPSGHPGLVSVAVVNPDLSIAERPRAYLYCPLGRPDGAPLEPGIGSGARLVNLRRGLDSVSGAADAALVVTVSSDGSLRRFEPGRLDRGRLDPRLPGDPEPRPDSFEPAIDPGLTRVILFPHPDCANR